MGIVVEYPPPQEYCESWGNPVHYPYAQPPMLPPASQYLPTICDPSTTVNQVRTPPNSTSLLCNEGCTWDFVPGGREHICGLILLLCSTFCLFSMRLPLTVMALPWVDQPMCQEPSCVLDHIHTMLMNLVLRRIVAVMWEVLVSQKNLL